MKAATKKRVAKVMVVPLAFAISPVMSTFVVGGLLASSDGSG